MKNYLTLFFFSLNLLSLSAATERNLLAKNQNPETLSKVLVQSQKWVPYPAYADREAWTKLMGENAAKYIRSGERRLNYEWKVIKATDYLEYERSGERNIMQNPNSDNSNALSDLVFAELAEGKGRFMDQIINGVFYQCERTSWTLSAHLPLQLSKRTIPEKDDPVIGLVSAEMGAFLSWTYYFFHDSFDKVNPEISKRLRYEIFSKIIIPYRTVDRFWWMAFIPDSSHTINNWNPWCNFNVLQCMLLMENDQEQLSKDVYRTMLSVDKFINYVKADGACEEGPSYWEHAAGKLYDYLQILYMATDAKISLFDQPMIKAMGEYISRSYVGDNWVVNFADASARFSSDVGIIYRYGKAIKSTEMMRFAAYLAKNNNLRINNGTDIFRTLESIVHFQDLHNTEPKHQTPDIIAYPETQFYYLKNNNQFFLATKGGYNNESHNHNDAGTFSLWFEQTPIIIDAGVGTYTRQTFGPERYSIWTMRSTYHNLALINGVEQSWGAEYKATKVNFDRNKKQISYNIDTAYPKNAAVNFWNRSYQLKTDKVIISDKFELSKSKAANEINFMLWGNAQILHDKVSIEVQNKKMELTYDSKKFTASLDTIVLDDVRLSKVWGNQIYRLNLKAKSNQLKDSYQFIIQQSKR